MKKFLVFAAMFAAMFLMVSCGGGDLNGDGVTYENGGDRVCVEFEREGGCNGHDVKSCVEGEKQWFDVEGTGKKFYCGSDDCDKAIKEMLEYCSNGAIDYEDDGDATCTRNTDEDRDTCKGEEIWFCADEDEVWYKVGDHRFKCSNDDQDGCFSASLELAEYCNFEGEEGNEGSESEFTEKATAYFPNAYAEKTLAAWYALTEKDENKIKIEAIFLFDDNTLVKTTSKVYSEADGREPEDKIEAEGGFTITSGDYDNGEAHVVLAEGMEFDVTISNGVLSAMDAEFTKQNNADLPEAR